VADDGGYEMDGRLRPADVLTSAAPFGGCGLAALDVSTVSPLSRLALDSYQRGRAYDCLQDAERKKCKLYQQVCKRAGWRFVPCVMSAFGRRGGGFDGAVSALCRAAARHLGEGVDAGRLAATWWRRAGTIVMDRNAAMVERCRPAAAACTPALFNGRPDEDAWDVDPHARVPVVSAASRTVGGPFYGAGGGPAGG
jgi:hypothetical protein